MQASEDAKGEVWQKKLGLSTWSSEAAGLLSDLLKLMRQCEADWTITWRQLAACLEVPVESGDAALVAPMVGQEEAHSAQHQGK